MTKERISELRDQLFHLERTIRPLEWDAGRNQINEYKKLELGRLKEQQRTLQEELVQLETAPIEAAIA